MQLNEEKYQQVVCIICTMVTKCAKPPIHCRNKAHTFLLVLDGNSFMSTPVIFQEVIWHAIEHNFQQTSEQIISLKDKALCGSRVFS